MVATIKDVAFNQEYMVHYVYTYSYPHIVVHHPSDLTTVANPTNVVYYCT